MAERNAEQLHYSLRERESQFYNEESENDETDASEIKEKCEGITWIYMW